LFSSFLLFKAVSRGLFLGIKTSPKYNLFEKLSCRIKKSCIRFRFQVLFDRNRTKLTATRCILYTVNAPKCVEEKPSGKGNGSTEGGGKEREGKNFSPKINSC